LQPFSLNAARSEAPLISLRQFSITWSGLSQRPQVKTDTSGTQLHVSKILEELSTFTFHQPTRWVGLTNNKSTSLCQSTIPHSTKVARRFCARNTYSKHSLRQLWDVIDPKLIQPLVPKKMFLRNETDATDPSF
jgi:hypothetical protein